MASVYLVMLPVTVQWFRRRGTPLDFAPLVDHYVALATQPLDQQLASLKKAETILTMKMDVYRAANPNADVPTRIPESPGQLSSSPGPSGGRNNVAGTSIEL
ncbi:MAG TPA: hypothetical protein VI306_08540 [Pyrinomonadaceae bacterium]